MSISAAFPICRPRSTRKPLPELRHHSHCLRRQGRAIRRIENVGPAGFELATNRSLPRGYEPVAEVGFPLTELLAFCSELRAHFRRSLPAAFKRLGYT